MSVATKERPAAKRRGGAEVARQPAPKPQAKTKQINLALQGGGAHGAFTWGVLDRLLEDPRIAFDGISGTSATARCWST